MVQFGKFHIFILPSIWLVVHIFLYFQYGIRKLFDAILYVKCADYFIDNGTLIDIKYLFYAVPISLIAFFRVLFPGEVVPYIIFQCLVSGLATFALYQASFIIFNSKVAAFFSSLIFLLWLDLIQWNTVTMTESLLASFTCFLLFYLTRFKNTIKNYIGIVILLVIIFFIRPTGVIIVVGAIAFLVKYNWPLLVTRPMAKVAVLGCIVTLSVVSATVLFTHWDFTKQYEKGNIVTYADLLEGNAYEENLRVQSKNLNLAEPGTPSILKIVHFAFYNPGYVLKTGSLKAWYLISFVRPYYSDFHNLYSLAWVSFIYGMFYLGFKTTSNGAIKLFVVTIIIVNCALIAVATVDWDNRFYIPMEPGIVVLAGGGVGYCIEKIRKKLLAKQHDNGSYKSNT